MTDEVSVLQEMICGLKPLRSHHGARFITSQTWVARAHTMWRAMFGAYAFLRERRDPFDAQQVANNYHLECLEAFAWDLGDFWGGKTIRAKGHFVERYGEDWAPVVRPLQKAIRNLPGYDMAKPCRQRVEVGDQYMFLVQQLTQLVGPQTTQDRACAADIAKALSFMNFRFLGEPIHENTHRCREVIGR